MGGAHLERRVARISLNSNFELRYSCFVYLFVYFVFFVFVFVFLWLLLEQEHITFLGCVQLPLPTGKNRGFSRDFRSGGTGGYLLSLYVFSEA